jgi:ribonuclease T2
MLSLWCRAALVAAVSTCLVGLANAQNHESRGRPGVFDYYVLSLSWSPSYCEAEGDDANGQQCAAGRPYAFVVHGLWPQYERGYPRQCATAQRRVPERLMQSLYDIMPSAGLIAHQWRMHGSCSGLDQRDYFRTLRQAREKVRIPRQFQDVGTYRSVSAEDVEAAFAAANPGLRDTGISVSCNRRLLREVRICMTKDLEFRSCGELDMRGCKADRLLMPPVRGR